MTKLLDQRGQELLMKTAGFFMQNGIKSHTMDDVSKFLGISKKTLYTYVSSKVDLVNRAMTLLMENDVQACNEVIAMKGNAIDKIYAINKRVSEKLEQTQPVIIYDLKNHYPEAWEIVQKHKSQFILMEIKNSLLDGIEEGLFRDMNVEIIATANVNLIYSIFEDKIFPSHKYSFSQIHNEILRYHIRGIANKKGLAYIEELIKKNETKRF